MNRSNNKNCTEIIYFEYRALAKNETQTYERTEIEQNSFVNALLHITHVAVCSWVEETVAYSSEWFRKKTKRDYITVFVAICTMLIYILLVNVLGKFGHRHRHHRRHWQAYMRYVHMNVFDTCDCTMHILYCW